LSRSTRRQGGPAFPSAFDRTHVLNTAAAYDFGRGIRAGARFTFYTGAPVIGAQNALLPTDRTNPTRDPVFYRIDLRLEKRWTLKKSRWLAVVLEMLNTTLHKEVIQGRSVGPVSIPSIGLEGGF